MSSCDFKQWYWGLKKDFNPVNFNPEQWAKTAKDAGMRYVVFTTKHHDGFCLFDTKETDFKITNGPFAGNLKANVAKYVFEAFRNQGFMIGAYFSKPDWHSEYYWWPKYATADRNNNYDIRKYSWRWNQFKQYTYNQISELMHDYGKIVDYDHQYEATLTKGKEKLIEFGFSTELTEKVIAYIKLFDAKKNLLVAPIEIQIVSSADGASHFVGPFYHVSRNSNT
jgi:alpha-L-fucosidase